MTDESDNDKKEETSKENTGPCDCDDLILDPDYNHFFLEKNTEPYTGTCQTFYKGKQIEVTADTSYKAQEIAAKQFKAKKSYDVTVMLLEKNGEQVSHSTQFI